MTQPTKSYLSVSYDLRPAKQVERRMMIDTMMRLAEAGFPIADYQYVGMGSIFFVDYVLFHRYLGLTKLISVEYDASIEKRVSFNAPFKLVDIEIASIGDVVAQLDRDLCHILWLDYDARIHADMLSDVVLACHRLSPGSILMVTVDAERPKHGEGPKDWMQYYRERVGGYFELGWDARDFTPSRLPETSFAILLNAVRRGLVARSNTHFLPLFKFVYADGHNMITLGGVIGTDTEKRKLQSAGLDELPFAKLNPEDEPYRIRVPTLTRKERLHLDSQMPCEDDWSPSAFELKKEDVLSYREVYRYYPIYAELLL